MATITSAASGPSNVGATWVGGAVPVEGDKVIIATGHVITVTGTHVWGDDVTYTSSSDALQMSTAAVLVNGTLKASRLTDSSLTVKGTLTIGSTNSTTFGTLDYGRSTTGSGVNDPIPLGVSATIVLGYSATLLAAKHGLSVLGYANLFTCGHFRETGAILIANAPISSSFIDVSQATGWQIGDVIGLGTTSDGVVTSTYEEVTINGAITAIAGGFRVPITPSITTLHLATCPIGNLTSNVLIVGFNATTGVGFITLAQANDIVTNKREVTNTRVENQGNNANASTTKKSCMGLSSNAALNNVNPTVIKNSIFYCRLSPTYCIGVGGRPRVVIEKCQFIGAQSAGLPAIFINGGGIGDFIDCNVLISSQGVNSNFSQGGQNCRFIRCNFTGLSSVVLTAGVGLSPEFYNCRFINFDTLISSSALAGALFKDCEIAFPIGKSIKSYFIAPAVNGYHTITVEDCKYPTSLIASQTPSTLATTPLDASFVEIINGNNDLTVQEFWKNTGDITRDNVVKLSSRSSIKFKAAIANVVHSKSYNVPATAGVASILRFHLTYNATYGTTTPPSVTVSGLGITPQTFTAGGSSGTTYSGNLTVTPVQSGNLTVVVSGTSVAVGGSFWFSGVVTPPYINWVYNYGYEYNPSASLQRVDSLVVLSESAAGALTGISFVGNTLTISSSHTISEVYDWMKWYETFNNLDPIFTSVDGINYSLSSDLVLNAPLSGSGTINMSSNTLTSTSTSSVTIIHNSGSLTSISITGLAANSRVRIYDITDSSQIYNSVVAGTSIILPFTYSSPKSLEIRVTNVNGVSAYLPFSSTQTITQNGVEFTIVQELDTVYQSNAIDGSTVSEFSTGISTVEVDVTDPDGITSVQRLYAWFVYTTYTSVGIVDYFGAIVAEDSVNYLIDTDIVDLKVKNTSVNSTIIQGARLYRKDGTTIFETGFGPIQLDSGKAYLAFGAVTLPEIEASTKLLTVAKYIALQ